LVPRDGIQEAQVGAETVAVLSDDATELVALLPPPLLGWTVVGHEWSTFIGSDTDTIISDPTSTQCQSKRSV